MTKQTKTVSIKGYVTYEDCPFNENGHPYSFQTWNPKHGSGERALIGELTIDVEVPTSFDPRPQMIQALEAEQRKAMADFEKLNTDILRKISQLQALEMTV